jgi:outer membrane protein assembly factor BamB
MPKNILAVLLLMLLELGLNGCSGAGPPLITAQPANQTVITGQAAVFTVGATGQKPLSYQWQKNGKLISGATYEVYTAPAAEFADSGSLFQVVVSNSLGTITSRAAQLDVHAPVDVLTYHNDIGRTGENKGETFLTPFNVSPKTFGKILFLPADGKVDAQPLFVAGLDIPSHGTHNVLYVATEHDSVYAFDADTGAVLWQSSLVGSGEAPADDYACPLVTPEIGITATPVIDRDKGAIYVVAMTKGSGVHFQRIHALDLATGTELSGGPTEVQAAFPGKGDNTNGTDVIFNPSQYLERAALLLLDGVVYTTWSSHCDNRGYTAWVIGYDASSLAQTKVLDLTPNGKQGGIWMSGGGPAADSAGNIYLMTGNGTFDTELDSYGFPTLGDFGNALVRLSTSGTLAATDYFTPFDTQAESDADRDLGSGGVLVLPRLQDSQGNDHHLAIGAGKERTVFVVDRDAMGKFSPSANHVYQELPAGALGGAVFSTPAYFNGTVYYGAVKDSIRAFAISDAKLATAPTSQTSYTFGYPGVTPGVSANGNASAIVWAVEHGSIAVLHAYDATNLALELYNSNQAGERDQFGPGNKYITPTVANGKVYVGTTNGVAVFGLLP